MRYLALLSVLCSGCAITLNMPSARFDSPESNGALGKGELAFAGSSVDEVTVVPLTTAVTPTESARFGTNGMLQAMGGLGLGPRVDVGITLNGGFDGMTPSFAKVKYQVLGDPVSEAKEGNTSLAFTFGVGYGSDEQDDQDTFVTPAIGARSSVSSTAFDFAAIGGYRALDWILFYGGPFYSTYTWNTTIDQSGGATGHYEFNGTAKQGGLNLGVQLGGAWFISKFEVAFTSVSAAGAHSTGLHGGIQLGARW